MISERSRLPSVRVAPQFFRRNERLRKPSFPGVFLQRISKYFRQGRSYFLGPVSGEPMRGLGREWTSPLIRVGDRQVTTRLGIGRSSFIQSETALAVTPIRRAKFFWVIPNSTISYEAIRCHREPRKHVQCNFFQRSQFEYSREWLPQPIEILFDSGVKQSVKCKV
jgi:hypothetical protein